MRQPAGDLLRRPSHSKVSSHHVPKVRLACQLEARIPTSPPCCQLMGAAGYVAAFELFRRLGVAAHFSRNCCGATPEFGCDRAQAVTVAQEVRNLYPLVLRELRILGSHSNTRHKVLHLIREFRGSARVAAFACVTAMPWRDHRAIRRLGQMPAYAGMTPPLLATTEPKSIAIIVARLF